MLAPPSLPGPFGVPLARLAARVSSWPVESQLRARRNAMVATTALTARRMEREDAEAFLAALPGPDAVAAPLAVRR